MKISLFALALLVGTASAQQEVYVMQVQSTTPLLFGKTKGTGRANYIEGAHVAGERDISTTPQGFTYSYVNCPALLPSNGKSFYPGRWGRDTRHLIIAVKKPGTNEVDECVLNVTLVPYTYTVQGARIVAVPRGGQ